MKKLLFVLLVLLAIPSLVSAIPLETNLTAYYTFDTDNISGVYPQDVINTNHFVENTGAVENESGARNEAFYFTSDITRIPAIVPINSNFSLSVWVKASNGAAANPIFSMSSSTISGKGFLSGYVNYGTEDGPYARLEGNDGLTLSYFNSSFGEPPTAEWEHYLYTFNNNTKEFIMYHNKTTYVTDASGSGDGVQTVAYNQFFIGLESTGGGSRSPRYTGYLDELGVWSRVLNATDAEQLYGFGTPPNYLSFGDEYTACNSTWICDGYGPYVCLANDTRTASCNSVYDNNSCENTYYGDYSEFNNDTGSCATVPAFNNIEGFVGVEMDLSANSTDAENLSITYYWEVYNLNDTLMLQNYSVANYTPVITDAHDTLRIRVYANNTYAPSASNETNITMSNTGPVVTSVNITPSPANDTQNLTASYACTDVDGDTCNVTVQYDWFINGNSTGIDSSLLTAGNISGTDEVIASVRTNDSYGYGGWTNSTTLVIGDETPPTINDFYFSSENIETGSSNTITANCTDVNTVSTVKAEITDPDLIKSNKTMSYSTGDLYTVSYTPGVEGTYQVSIFCIDGSGNVGVSNETKSFTANAPVGGGGGGGGGSVSTGDVISALGGVLISEETDIFVSPGTKKVIEIQITNEAPVSKDLVVFVGNNQDATSWIQFLDGSRSTIYDLPAGGGLTSPTRYFRFEIIVPADVEFGDYEGSIVFSDDGDLFVHDLNIHVIDGFLGQVQVLLNTELVEFDGGCPDAFSTADVCEPTPGFAFKVWHLLMIVSVIGTLFFFMRKRRT